MVTGYDSDINRLYIVGNFYAKVADILNMPLLKYNGVLIKYLSSTCFREVTAK